MKTSISLLAGIVMAVTAPGQVISTLAGTFYTFPQRTLPALQAPIGNISGVVVDAAGNAYVSDVNNHIILRVTPSGEISVFAGIGLPGYAGDGGVATSAALNGPRGMVFDAQGNMYIADEFNHRIRKVDTDGNMSTVAGSGIAGFAGDGGPALNAQLNIPTEVTLDAQGNLFIADEYNHRIRRVDVRTGLIDTVAGDGRATFSGDNGPARNASLYFPRGIAFDSRGQLYISDQYNQRIRRVAANGTITTYAGTGQNGSGGDGGAATSAQLNFPAAIAFDSAGNLYIAEKENHIIRRVTSAGIIGTFAGNRVYSFSGDGGQATNASLFHPEGVTVDSRNNVYIADSDNNRLRRVAPTGIITTLAGNGSNRRSGDGGPATSAVLNVPFGLLLDASGNLLFSDANARVIRRIAASGVITTFAGSGNVGFGGDNGPAALATFAQPQAIAIDRSGNVFLADGLGQNIRRIATNNVITNFAGQPGRFGFSPDNTPAASAFFNSPTGLAFDANGNLIVADRDNNRIRRISASGVSTIAGNGERGFGGDNGPATAATLNAPGSVVISSDGDIYFADSGNHRIRRIDARGNISTFAGTGRPGFRGDNGAALNADLQQPAGISFDSRGALLIADFGNHAVRRVSGGVITTLAGNGNPGFSGDGDLAAAARLNRPTAAIADSRGNIYIADSGNNRVRQIFAAQASFNLSATELAFSATSGGAPTPAQNVTISSTIPNLPFTAQTSDPWIVIASPSATLPATLQISVDPNSLSPSSLTGVITVTVPNAEPPTRSILVTAEIANAQPPRLAVSDQSLSFSVEQGASPVTSQLTVSNSGGGSLDFTAAATTRSGGPWLQVNPASGSLAANARAVLNVTADGAGLGGGSYSGSIVVASPTTGEQFTVNVTIVVTATQPKIVLSQTGLTFTAVQQGGAVLPQNIAILNSGSGTLNWQASATTLSGSGWLSLSATNGTVRRPFLDVSFVDVNVDARGLGSGTYYGRVTVTAGGALNSPQTTLVVLQVLPPGSNPGPEVRPTGLVFTGIQGEGNPQSQNVQVSNVAGGVLNYGSNIAYVTPGTYLSYLPTNTTVPAQNPVRVVVQPDFRGLSSGIQRAALTLAFDDGSIRSVAILSVIAPPGSRAVAGKGSGARAAGACMPTRTIPVFTSLGTGAMVPAGFPSTIGVRVVDDCGSPMTGGSVVASFSNGDPPLSLTNLQNGSWTTSWQPSRQLGAGVTIGIQANQPELGLQGSTQLTVGVQSGDAVPVLFRAPRSPITQTEGPIAPGDVILIQGSGLADGQASSPTPLEELAGTSVTVGNSLALLLYADSTRVLGLVPNTVKPNTPQQVVVQRNANLGVPVPVVVADAHPTVVTRDAGGAGAALAYRITGAGLDARIEPGSPARPGETVMLYVTGLGLTTDQGAAANSVAVNIGGQSAEVVSATLVGQSQVPPEGMPALLDGAVSLGSGGGVFAVTIRIPDTAAGDASLVVSAAGQDSQAAVTLAIGERAAAPLRRSR